MFRESFGLNQIAKKSSQALKIFFTLAVLRDNLPVSIEINVHFSLHLFKSLMYISLFDMVLKSLKPISNVAYLLAYH